MILRRWRSCGPPDRIPSTAGTNGTAVGAPRTRIHKGGISNIEQGMSKAWTTRMNRSRKAVAFEVQHSVFNIRYSVLHSAVEQIAYAESDPSQGLCRIRSPGREGRLVPG